jgi:hypothetical protein
MTDWEGQAIYCINKSNRLVVLDRDGHVLYTHQLPESVTDANVDKTGNGLVVGTSAGNVQLYEIAEDSQDAMHYLEVCQARQGFGSAKRPTWSKAVYDPIDSNTFGLIALSASGETVAFLDAYNLLRFFDGEGHQLSGSVRLGGAFPEMRTSEDGRVLLVATANNVFLTDLYSRGDRIIEHRDVSIVASCLSKDGRYLALANEVNEVEVYDSRLEGLWSKYIRAAATSMCFDAAAGRLLVGLEAGPCLCFDMTGGLLWKSDFVTNASPIVLAGPDGFYVGSERGDVLSVDLAGKVVWQLDLGTPLVDAYFAGERLVARTQREYCIVEPPGSVAQRLPASPGTSRLFLAIDGTLSEAAFRERLISLRSPQGQVRWRFEAGEYVTQLAVAANGGALAALAGRYLNYFPTLEALPGPQASFLEL